MRIGEIAQRTGVSAKTIRYWEDERLVAQPARTPSGYRDYEAGVGDRITFIRNAQTAGFTLEQIRQILEISDSGNAPCEHVEALIEGHLSDVDARIAELTRTRRHLELLARRASRQDPANCDGYCSIVVPRSASERSAHR